MMPSKIRSDVKFSIICSVHGVFMQSPTAHNRYGCRACSELEFVKTPAERKATRDAYNRQYSVSGKQGESAKRRYHKDPRIKKKIAVRNNAIYHRTKHLPNNKAALICRTLIQRATLASCGTKNMRTETTLGYTFIEFKQHIESLFVPGMSWINHGEWHVDHIKPVSLFIAQGITDPAIINALDNLQPLPAIDNLIKGARYPL